ncbi:cysteine-rich receptor-like protein kinase 25 [Bidens hawaiensis]|uniref:cysteine-rich receptor-like protein kinase 25 n=1 Tax=Bidens hawaiensis TaxID=980011 RepID=UPI004049F75E
MSTVTWKPFLLLSLIFIYLINFSIILAQTDPYVDKLCDNSYLNYTTNSSFRTNLDQALRILPTTNSGYGFFNTSSGRTPDTAYAIALCRGDTNTSLCVDCLNNATARLRQDCPNQKDAAMYYDNCMVKYSDNIILGKTAAKNIIPHASLLNASDPAGFNQDLRKLLANLTAEAAGGGLLKYATGTMARSSDPPATYALVQCTPDLTNQQCTECLGDAVSQLAKYFGSTGMRVLLPLCNLRFESFRFYNDVVVRPPSPPPPPPPSPSAPVVRARNNKNLTRIVTSTVMTIAACVIIVVSLCNFAILRKKKLLEKSLEGKTMDISILEFLEYSLDRVLEATNDFSEDNKIGQGGFGSVYKGELEDGKLIAVKRLSRDSGQGEQQFKNEVMLVAKLHHRNLVGLLGFCVEEKERLLIYDFLSNSSLDKFIFDPVKRELLDWDTRYNIIVGVARGLLYLHEDSRLRVIHRDLKASNVLLDEKMNAKITDFGIARLFNTDQTQGNTRMVVGTYGYMAPEYVMHGRFSVKLDVFSFGVLMIEVITGRKNQSFQHENGVDLLTHVWRNWQVGTPSNIIDPILLRGSSPLYEIIRSIHISLLCVQKNVAGRPIMSQVVLMLGSSSLTLQVPLEPGFFIHDSVDQQGSITSKSPNVSINDLSNTNMAPR